MNKEVSDALHFLLHCSLKDKEYTTQKEQFEFVYNEINDLQSRIDKAIEYIKNANFWGIYEDTPMSEVKYGTELLSILEGDDKE